MIRQSEGAAAAIEVKSEEKQEKAYAQKDNALWAPTGWVHVEKDIDFSDPKVTFIYYLTIIQKQILLFINLISYLINIDLISLLFYFLVFLSSFI